MANEETERKVAYAFLEDLKKTFYNTFNLTEIQNARSYELNFADQIKKKIEFFNEKGIGFDDKAKDVMKDLEGVKNVLVENMEKLLERDFKIEVWLSKAREINQYSMTYKDAF